MAHLKKFSRLICGMAPFFWPRVAPTYTYLISLVFIEIEFSVLAFIFSLSTFVGKLSFSFFRKIFLLSLKREDLKQPFQGR